MTLTPETRVMLTDALRPPAGYRVDVAVGTTYSLNLTALLLAPLSFALFDQGNVDDIGAVDPIRLLEAVRRHADHTTVFCQAGGIHVPGNYRSILTFVEDSVLEVMPPNDGAIFHPKIWAIRFENPEGERLHRFAILSRNLTLDRSWDTALVLDEDEAGPIDAAPAGAFVAHLPGFAIRPLDERRTAEIADLATSLAGVRLAVPSPFTDGELIPIGMSSDRVWPFPSEGRRLLAISPFLTKGAVESIGRVATERTLVSRAEALELVGSRSLDGWSINVLQRLAEVDPEDDVADMSTVTPDGFLETHDGLHAKTFVIDEPGGQSTVVTGSANLTSPTWGTNVEFDAVLRGPTSACGVEMVLHGSAEAPGLSRILEEYSVTDTEGAADPSIETSYELERFHQQLAASEPTLHVAHVDDDRVTVTLSLDIPANVPGASRIWPASLLADTQGQPIARTLSWTIAPINVTPFIAVETTLGEGAARVTRSCVIKASLTGATDGRRQDAVFSILRSKEDVLRYLVFLLGDPSYDALFAQLAGVDGERFNGSDRPVLTSADVALFEPLVRATGRDQDALARVASLIEDLRALPNGDELVPDGFEELWDVVWQVHQEHRA
jgi:hypothetical protein